MESNELINRAVKSTLNTIQIDAGTHRSAGSARGCLIAYKERLFFVCVQYISGKSSLQIVLETGQALGATTDPLFGLRFSDALNVDPSTIEASAFKELESVSLCYAEIKEALELNQTAVKLGAITISAGEKKTISSKLDYMHTKEESFVFYGGTIGSESIVHSDKIVLGIKNAGKTGPFERFIMDASTLESLNFKATMGAPMFSETGEFAALVALADSEQKLLYGFSAAAIQKNLDDYIHQNPKVVDDGLESFHLNPLKKDYITYSVLYGTNRAALQKSNKLAYGGARDKNLNLGYCNISIPLKHELGQIERPGWFNKLFFNESPAKYFTILSNEQTEEAIFIDLLRQKLGQSDEKDVLLFIHGFNVAFDEAMMRAAQLGYDLNFKGGVAAFSWPSLGTISGYIADSDSAGYSRDHLCAFIKLLIQSGTQKLHIIAHSMGNVVLTQALLQLKNEGIFPNPIIHQIILAAPDLDKDIFLSQILPAIKGASKFTLYASDKDNALLAAKKIRHGYIRLGEGGDDIVIVDGLDSIDASTVDTSLLGHGYFSDTQSLLNDIHLVLLDLPPGKRVLNPKSKLIDGISKEYWVFKNS
ncbi:MAG: alpha/beta fold hydrolase [Phycisphaerae bacterium]|nr:alpha/beta fold hydrolase [Saprospiraceae bacterium]